jgi:hypothetical protein
MDDFLDWAFIEMPVEAQVMVIDDVLADSPPERRLMLLRDYELLGIEAAAHCIGLPLSKELRRDLAAFSLRRLADAVGRALLARLPAIA